MMMEEFVKAVLKKRIASDYPYLVTPPIVFASIKQAKQPVSTSPWYEYELEVVDRFGTSDDSFPPVPGVSFKGRLEVGSTVAIALAYGDIPVVLGEVQL